MESLSDVVARRSFSQVKRGYDPREVEGFLTDIVDKIRAVEGELATTYGKLNAFERSADAEKDAGMVVQDAFRVATQRRDEIIRDAEVRAAAILSEAETRAGLARSHPSGVAQAEADVIVAEARDEAGRLIVAAEQRAREILRVARSEADQEAANAMVDAREGATKAVAEYRQVVQQLRELKGAVNQMLQDGAGSNEEIRLVFSSEVASPTP